MARHVKFAGVLLCAAVALWSAAASAAPVSGFTDPLLPPVNPDPAVGYYGFGVHASYPQGIVVNEPFLHAFTGITRLASGADEQEAFSLTVSGLVDVPSMSLSGVPLTLTGTGTAIVRNYTSGQLGTFSAEILSLNVSTSILGQPVMLRESPTLASTGQVTIAGSPGNYTMDSFFDVFTELSLDGGQTWGPDTNGPAHEVLAPEPGSLSLLALGAMALLRRRRAGTGR